MEQEINIEEIMKEIRADIKARGLENDDPPFNSIPISASGTVGGLNPDELLAYSVVTVYRPITSRPGVLGKLIILFKKIVRKCVVFILLPMATDQTRFNQAMVKHMEQLGVVNDTHAQQAQEALERLAVLAEEMETQRKRYDQELSRLRQENAEIMKGLPGKFGAEDS